MTTRAGLALALAFGLHGASAAVKASGQESPDRGAPPRAPAMTVEDVMHGRESPAPGTGGLNSDFFGSGRRLFGSIGARLGSAWLASAQIGYALGGRPLSAPRTRVDVALSHDILPRDRVGRAGSRPAGRHLPGPWRAARTASIPRPYPRPIPLARTGIQDE